MRRSTVILRGGSAAANGSSGGATGAERVRAAVAELRAAGTPPAEILRRVGPVSRELGDPAGWLPLLVWPDLPPMSWEEYHAEERDRHLGPLADAPAHRRRRPATRRGRLRRMVRRELRRLLPEVLARELPEAVMVLVTEALRRRRRA